jgi:GT2 family glycosyltransferase
VKVIAIIVTYNGIKWYQKCFDSLINSIIPIEIIAIDNNSVDETVPFIKDNYPKIKLIENSENLGFGKANNIGLQYAIEQNADFVFLLNQDAWIKPDTIEKLIAQMHQSDYGILSPIHLSGDEKKLDFGFARYISADHCPDFISDFVANGKAIDKVYPIKFVNAAMWLMSRDCLNTVGGFAPIFPHYGEDFNYTDRCKYHKQKIGIYPYAIGIHDRVIKDAKKMTVKQIRQANYVDNLVALTDINRSLSASLLKFPFQSLGYNLKNYAAWKSILLFLLSIVDVLKVLPKVYKERAMMKKMGRIFLG